MTVGLLNFDDSKADLFISALQLARDKEREGIVESRHFLEDGNGSRYARFTDLKFWGLLHQCPDQLDQGIYQITPIAKQFFMGKVTIPKNLKVIGGRVVERSEETISLEKALRKKWAEIGPWISECRKNNPHWEEEK